MTINITGGGREVLTAARTYYVRTDGSDSNTGLANTADGAFLTGQKAINVIAGTLDLNNYNVTVQFAAGTYTGTMQFYYPWVGAGTVTFLGDATTPTNVVISTTSAIGFDVWNKCVVTISGFKVQTTTGGSAVNVERGGVLSIVGLMEFGAAAGLAQLRVATGAVCIVTGNYTISGAAARHIYVTQNGILTNGSKTITVSGTPAFSTAFINVDIAGTAQCATITFSGSATGSRYKVESNGVIYTAGAGTTYFPGDAAGTGTNSGTTPFGLYA